MDISSSPANGSQALAWDQAIANYGVYPNAVGAAYPELVDQLMTLYRDKVSKIAFVPSDWLAGVQAIAATPAAPVITTPYMNDGTPKAAGTFPDWILSDKSRSDAWNHVAQEVRLVVSNYAMGKVEEGRSVMARLNANATFWATLYSVATTIADAPKNIVGGILGGAQSVVGGVLGKLFGSWLVWLVLLVVGGFFAWRLGLLGLLKRRKG